MAWGRTVEKAIQQLELEAERRAQGEINTNKGQNGIMNALARQIQDLSSRTRTAFEVRTASANGFAIPSSATIMATLTLSVPSGMTRALITATGLAYGFNATGSSTDIQADVIINGALGSYAFGPAAPSDSGCATPSMFLEVDGLVDGGTIPVNIRVLSHIPLAANVGNQAVVSAQAIYLAG
jgi:hypothetical protein